MLKHALRALISLAYLTVCSFASAVTLNSGAVADSPFQPATQAARRLWSTNRGPVPAAEQALTILRDAQSHGLRADNYPIHELTSLHQRFSQGESDLRELYEGLMTDALLRLFRDLRPQLVHSNSRSEADDLLGMILAEAIASDTLADFYASLLPRHRQYEALRTALAKEEVTAAAPQMPLIGRGASLRVGDTGVRVSALRVRLNVVQQTAGDDHDVFDESLESAVMAYQSLHGLEADGIVGQRTQQHMDMSAAERAARIRVALARWRELPAGLGDDYVHVNIPEYRLEMIRNGQPQVEMKVVVGSKDNPTPTFNDEIEYLVFNPYWYVPRTIALEELVPKAVEIPGYLSARNYEVLKDGEVIDESSIDWTAISASNFGYRIRQRPGPGNALGSVKFLFPNSMNIYLHDSPARSLYERTVRAFSHGCIRLEDPAALATALLEQEGDWTQDQVDRTMSRGSRRQVNLDRSIPVYLTYITARVTDSGELALFDDIYDRDSALLQRHL